MCAHRPVSQTANPSPPFRLNSPDPLADQGSRLHQRLATIRAFIAREQLLCGNARVNRAAAEERVEGLRQHDEEDAKRIEAQHHKPAQSIDSSNSDTTDPSVAAAKAAVTNENGFGDEDQPIGWFNHMQTRGEKVPAQSRKGQLYESLEAAAEAAIDNAAD